MNNAAARHGAQPESPEKAFLDALRGGTAKVQQCDGCGHRFFFPRTHCPHCRSDRYTWVAMGSAGTIYSYSEIPAQGERPGRNVILVDMEDGFRMMSTCPACGPGALRIGMPVRAAVDSTTEPPRIVFEEVGQ
ncbi:Zn-ribbon domain-containing OB-fold protein [Cupriavidus sp. L7L]|uniref:Zn-ribbon domain-containing OB-fold protein n=1 Tax=Cupriavidus sp. L7L TaxID=2546443 RepID=UPI00105449CF|nr:OB-fold domain-containing protein [Cupriavidus sp. L7L]TDF64509.1 DNA-binding protein [Cupriavidus sp. L7L]